ncbi:MAG: hypothetical protein ABW154_14120 [Dyella sp.]
MKLIALASYNAKDGRRIRRGDAFVTDKAHAAELVSNRLAKPADEIPPDAALASKALGDAPENKMRGRKKAG